MKNSNKFLSHVGEEVDAIGDSLDQSRHKDIINNTPDPPKGRIKVILVEILYVSSVL